MGTNGRRWLLVAAFVIVITTFVVWLVHFATTSSERTAFGTDDRNGTPIKLPVPPDSIVQMPDSQDAGPIYRRAILKYLGDPFTYGRFARSGTSVNEIDNLPAIQILQDATKCSSANIFAPKPSEIVNFKNEKLALEALQKLAACARRAGQLIEKARPAEAMKHYEAVFSLGVKLYQERLTYAELDAGLTMMAEGSALIGLLDPSRADATHQFDEARRQYVKDRILPMEAVLNSIDQSTLEAHAGDVAYFARSARDRMWRVEAIFGLARYRFNAGRIADQRNAMGIIQALCTDPDPVIREAADAARGLTVEEYRMLR